MAKLVTGIPIIRVGASTETELKEKKARVEDAMHATRAAVEEGIVPGGGVVLIRAAMALNNFKVFETDEDGKACRDLVAAGVIGPAKVTRSALQNASSIAGLMLTTEALISEMPDDTSRQAIATACGRSQ